MERFRAFLRRKNIVFSAKRYGVDALGAMAQGLFCTLLVGTILDTLGTQFHIGFLSATVVTVGSGEAAVGYTIGGLASLMVGPAMAVAIGSALQAPPLVLFSLVPVGYRHQRLGRGWRSPGGAGHRHHRRRAAARPVSKETKVDILVTPIVTMLVGIGAADLIAPPIGAAASAPWAMSSCGPRSCSPSSWASWSLSSWAWPSPCPSPRAAICAALGLTGLAGGAAVAGLLRPDGGLRRALLPGEPLGRPGVARAWAPPCSRWATSSATPGFGSRPRWPRPSRGPLPPACSSCR